MTSLHRGLGYFIPQVAKGSKEWRRAQRLLRSKPDRGTAYREFGEAACGASNGDHMAEVMSDSEPPEAEIPTAVAEQRTIRLEVPELEHVSSRHRSTRGQENPQPKCGKQGFRRDGKDGAESGGECGSRARQLTSIFSMPKLNLSVLKSYKKRVVKLNK